MDTDLTTPTGMWLAFLGDVAFAMVVFALGWFASAWARTAVLSVLRGRRIDEALARFLATVAQWAILVVAVVIALSEVGVETTSLVALVGSAGIAIGLALQGNLSNLASGVMLLVFRPFDLGEFVTIGGESGTIDDMGLFATRLVTPDNKLVLIPNASITSNPVTNFSRLGTRRCDIDVAVAYGSDVAKVQEVLLGAGRAATGALSEPEPMVLLRGLGASGLEFQLFVWCRAADYLVVASAARRAVYEALNREGIAIPFPQVTVHTAAPAQPPSAARRSKSATT